MKMISTSLACLCLLLCPPGGLSQKTVVYSQSSSVSSSAEIETTTPPGTVSWIERIKNARKNKSQGHETRLLGTIEELSDHEEREDVEEYLLEGGSDHIPVYFQGGPLGKDISRSTSYEHLFHSSPPTIVSSLNSPVTSLTSSSSNNYETSSPHSSGVKTGYFPPKQRVMPRVSHMEAECSDDIMKLRVQFNATFQGLIYSAGYAYDNNCIYVNGTGDTTYDFFIQLNRCGTLGGSDHKKKREVGYKNTEPTKNVMWNTVTIQYSPLIEEEWDEHFKVTCEYGYDFWKTVTFPFLDVEVNTADPVHFSLNPPECHMEIRQGYGTSGHRISGPVHVGDPLTLLINMRSEYDGFDILVNDCYAHNGANKKIQLIDHHGCPVDEKLISRFQGNWGMNNALYETVIYAHMKTFRFTGTPALYIECDIRMCHGKCPTQSCNWRNLNANTRRRRSLEDTEIDEEEESIILSETSGNSSQPEGGLSERFNLFQAIHVLQSREEEVGGQNNTESGSRNSGSPQKDAQCMSSNFFTVIVGILTFLSVSFGVAVFVLYIRLKRSMLLNGEGHHHHHVSTPNLPNGRFFDEMSRISCKSEYVHSNQARIP